MNVGAEMYDERTNYYDGDDDDDAINFRFLTL